MINSCFSIHVTADQCDLTTVEPTYNDPRYNELSAIMTTFHCIWNCLWKLHPDIHNEHFQKRRNVTTNTSNSVAIKGGCMRISEAQKHDQLGAWQRAYNCLDERAPRVDFRILEEFQNPWKPGLSRHVSRVLQGKAVQCAVVALLAQFSMRNCEHYT